MTLCHKNAKAGRVYRSRKKVELYEHKVLKEPKHKDN